MHSHTYPCARVHTHTHTLEDVKSSESGKGSPPLSVYIAAVLQSDKGKQRFHNRVAASATAAPSGSTLNLRLMLQTDPQTTTGREYNSK